VSDLGRRLADAIAHDAGITNGALLDAFASVPRERFLGPPPWLIAKSANDGRSARRAKKLAILPRSTPTSR
jgi:hypothetical protein